MIPFQLPFSLIATGVPVWIVGAVLERSARRRGRELKESKAAAMLYTLACIGAWGVYFYVSFLSSRNQRALDGVWTEITQISLAGDPVLNFLMWAIVVLVAAALIPGFIGVGLYLIGITLGLAFFLALVVQPLIALARVSISAGVKIDQ